MKVFKVIAKVVIFICLLNIASFSVFHVLNGGGLFGSMSSYIVSFAAFPNTVKKTFKQLSSSVRHYQLEIDEGFEYVNQLDQDLHVLTSYYSEQGDSVKIKLINLKNNNVEHEWWYHSETLLKDGLSINHPILLEDYSVIFQVELAYMIRLDSNSNVIWKNDKKLFHHSIEMDSDHNVWSPTTDESGKFNRNAKVVNFKKELIYRDDYITKIDTRSGEILFDKSVSEILIENNYKSLLYGFWQHDPIHLNDVQPVHGNSEYWQQGDLLISCRNIHAVFLYRPTTNRVVWLKIGPWINQHDIDILDSATITIYNNNINLNHYDIISNGKTVGRDTEGIKAISAPVKYNKVVAYSLKSDSAYVLYNDLLAREKINTRSQGVLHILKDGNAFIEETDQGKLFVGNDESTLFRQQLISEDSTYVSYPGWTRVYEQLHEK